MSWMSAGCGGRLALPMHGAPQALVHALWGLQSVAKFITKAYPVSGCFDYLSEVSTDMFMRLECIAVPVVRKAGVTVYVVILDV